MKFDQVEFDGSVERVVVVVEKWMDRNAKAGLTPSERKQATKEIDSALAREAKRSLTKKATKDGQDR